MPSWFVADHLPVLFIVGTGDFDDELVQKYKDVFTALHEQGKPWLVLSDSRWSNIPDSAARKRIADMSDWLTERTASVVLATAAILPNRLMAGAATAVGWMVRRKQGSLKYFSSAKDGMTFLQEVGAQKAIEIPSSAVDLALRLDQLFAKGEEVSSLGLKSL